VQVSSNKLKPIRNPTYLRLPLTSVFVKIYFGLWVYVVKVGLLMHSRYQTLFIRKVNVEFNIVLNLLGSMAGTIANEHLFYFPIVKSC
jgi:hypothetical protein